MHGQGDAAAVPDVWIWRRKASDVKLALASLRRIIRETLPMTEQPIGSPSRPLEPAKPQWRDPPQASLESLGLRVPFPYTCGRVSLPPFPVGVGLEGSQLELTLSFYSGRWWIGPKMNPRVPLPFAGAISDVGRPDRLSRDAVGAFVDELGLMVRRRRLHRAKREKVAALRGARLKVLAEKARLAAGIEADDMSLRWNSRSGSLRVVVGECGGRGRRVFLEVRLPLADVDGGEARIQDAVGAAVRIREGFADLGTADWRIW